MQENNIRAPLIHITTPEQKSNIIGTSETYNDWQVQYHDKLHKPIITVDQNQNTIEINAAKFPDEQTAHFYGIREGLAYATLSTWPRDNLLTLINTQKKDKPIFSPQSVLRIALFEGARTIADIDPSKAESVVSIIPPARTYEDEFLNACLTYALKKEFPPVSPEVKKILDRLPTAKLKDGTIIFILDAINNNTRFSLNTRFNNYHTYIAPFLDELKKKDQKNRTTEEDSFTPSMDDGEKIPLEEKDILQRVSPFYGGYYREKVYNQIDWETMSVIAPQLSESTYIISFDEEVALRESQQTVYKYVGLQPPATSDEYVSLPLPRSTRPLPSSLEKKYRINIDPTGCFSLSLQETPYNDKVSPYSFQFVVDKKHTHSWEKDPPQDDDYFIPQEILDTLSQKTIQLLENLEKTSLTTSAKINHILSYETDLLTYSMDKNISDLYKQAGKRYFAELETRKLADCDVSGFYTIVLGRATGVACRMVSGYFVRKDPRFDFAPIAGIKHAWMEYWDKENKKWIMRDPTPPKKDEKEEQKDDSSGDGKNEQTNQITDTENIRFAPEEGDYENQMKTIEQALLDNIKNIVDQIYQTNSELSPRVKASISEFEEKHHVSFEKWRKVKEHIDEINKTLIQKSLTIEKIRDSTIQEEWKIFFELFLRRYTIPLSRGHAPLTTNDKGDIPVDPASIITDLYAGNANPFGFQMRRHISRHKEILLPIAFSNDMILDCTSSMEATDNDGRTLIENERDFVLTDLYHTLTLNDVIQSHRHQIREKEIACMTNHLISIHGNNSYKELTQGAVLITRKQLVDLLELFSQTTPGAGNMHQALETYYDKTIADTKTLELIAHGKMLKMLTVVSDGNMWCSVCGEESCNYQHDENSIKKTVNMIKQLRTLGIPVHAIGFSNTSKPVIELFKNPDHPHASIIAHTMKEAVSAHYTQVFEALSPMIRTV